MSVAGVFEWRSELSELHARLGELFVRSEPRRQAGLYLEGLLSAVERKNGWQLAEHLGDARPWRTQRLLSHVQWDEEAARELCRGYVVEHLADREGVLIVDETGFLKKGMKSAGVAATVTASDKKGQSEPDLWSISAQMKSAISSAACNRAPA